MTSPGRTPEADKLRKRVAGLDPDMRAKLDRALLSKRASAKPSCIPRRDPSVPARPSFGQQRLWFLDRLAPGEPTYNALVALQLDGPLDADLLRRGLTRAVARHEALRTVFRPSPTGEPLQVVLDRWELTLPVIDLSSAANPDAELRRVAREQARRPFDLAADLMLRPILVRRTETCHVLLLVEHHIAFDGWSDEVLLEEVSAVYRAGLAGTDATLPPLAVQYADFSAWQRSELAGARGEQLAGFWRAALADAAAVLPLPLDLPRPDVQTFDGVHAEIILEPALVAAALSLGAACRATPYMTMLASYVALLSRWARIDDIVVGTPVACRSRIELENLVGFFSNTVPIRTRVPAGTTFRTLLGATRDAALAAYEHQDLPFDRIVTAVAPPRDPRVNPLFQVNFRVQSGDSKGLELPGVRCRLVEFDIGFARFDLALELQVRNGGTTGYWEYNERLFTAATIQRLHTSFVALLTDAVSRPDVPLVELSFPLATAAGGGIRGARARR